MLDENPIYWITHVRDSIVALRPQRAGSGWLLPAAGVRTYPAPGDPALHRAVSGNIAHRASNDSRRFIYAYAGGELPMDQRLGELRQRRVPRKAGDHGRIRRHYFVALGRRPRQGRRLSHGKVSPCLHNFSDGCCGRGTSRLLPWAAFGRLISADSVVRKRVWRR